MRLLPVFCCGFVLFFATSHAQFPLALPQLPAPSTLPLVINTNSYFLFGWDGGYPQGSPPIVPESVPLEARSGVTKFGEIWPYSYFIKNNGQVMLYTSQWMGGAMSFFKIRLPQFYSSNIAAFYNIGVVNPYHFLGLSKEGQVGVLFETNLETFNVSSVCTNVTKIFYNPPPAWIPESPGFRSRFLSLHADGLLRAWQAESGYFSEIPHPTGALQDVREVAGRVGLGLALLGDGQIYGWRWNSASEQYDDLPIPSEASANIVRIFSPASEEQKFYAIRSDGLLICWDVTGNRKDLPSSFGEKHFVHVANNITWGPEGIDFGLTTEGEVLGWRYPPNGTLSEIITEPSLQSGIVALAASSNGYLGALTSNDRLLAIEQSWNQTWEWGPSSNFPVDVASGQALLESLYFKGAHHGGYVLSTNGDLAVSTYAGLPLDVLAQLVAEKILNTTNNFGLALKTEVGGAVTQGVQQVLSAPSDYNLFTTQQVQAERLAGQNDVVSNPNQWTLYTTNQIKNMAIGDLVLTRTNHGAFILNYEIEQSEDLVTWVPYQGFAMPLTNLPTNKAFVRIKAKD